MALTGSLWGTTDMKQDKPTIQRRKRNYAKKIMNDPLVMNA